MGGSSRAPKLPKRSTIERLTKTGSQCVPEMMNWLNCLRDSKFDEAKCASHMLKLNECVAKSVSSSSPSSFYISNNKRPATNFVLPSMLRSHQNKSNARAPSFTISSDCTTCKEDDLVARYNKTRHVIDNYASCLLLKQQRSKIRLSLGLFISLSFLSIHCI